MITRRAGKDRGHTDMGWLDSHHTFSFGGYRDPRHEGFRTLRVINDDRVAAGQGFGTHGHRDMEIISYVLAGKLAHEDTLGNQSLIEPGDVQRMTAGTGVQHAEYNPSKEDAVHFLQIWLMPETRSLPPSYEQKRFSPEELKGKLRLVAARDGREGSLTVHQDVALYAGKLGAGDAATLPLQSGRHAWVQVARGEVALNGTPLAEGDGAAVSDERALAIENRGSLEAEVLVFDLA